MQTKNYNHKYFDNIDSNLKEYTKDDLIRIMRDVYDHMSKRSNMYKNKYMELFEQVAEEYPEFVHDGGVEGYYDERNGESLAEYRMGK